MYINSTGRVPDAVHSVTFIPQMLTSPERCFGDSVLSSAERNATFRSVSSLRRRRHALLNHYQT